MERTQQKEAPRYIIIHDNKLKLVWDIYVMFVLVLTTFIIPYRLAFYESDTLEWELLYYFFDLMFLIDVFLCFITSYTDELLQIEITSPKLIAINYIRGWFTIDILSIFPFDVVLSGNSNANALIRIARIGKMYKILRLFRLLKILKLVK
jgi:hypothetical protein